jgi:hypothetical protein
MEKINLHEKSLFMNGDKLVAIISEAASTGATPSYRASRLVHHHQASFFCRRHHRGTCIS